MPPMKTTTAPSLRPVTADFSSDPTMRDLLWTGTYTPANSASIHRFKPGDVIRPNQVIHLNQRSGDPDDPHLFHRKIKDTYRQLQKLERKGRVIPHDLPQDVIRDPELKRLFKQGLKDGSFKDTTHINHVIQTLNRNVARFREVGLDDLEIVEVHADSYIDDLIEEIIENGNHPAGIIMGGSHKMITRAKFGYELVNGVIVESQVVPKTMELAAYAFENEIPALGICFGNQVFAETVYGSEGRVVDWLHVPKGVKFSKTHPDAPALPIGVAQGAKQLVYGSRRIRYTGILDPLMNNAHSVDVLKLHSQAIPYPSEFIPNDAVLATSARIFLPEIDSPESEWIVEHMAEIVRYGEYAYGTQLHPELTPNLLLALTYIPQYANILENEGLNLKQIRNDLKAYPHASLAGQSFADNWCQIMLDRYLHQLTDQYANDREVRPHLESALAFLHATNPALF